MHTAIPLVHTTDHFYSIFFRRVPVIEYSKMVRNFQLLTKSLLGQWFCNTPPLPHTLELFKGPQEDYPPKLRLIDLPSDVLFSITDHLDTPSVHSLSLTCRSLYASRFPATQRPLSPEDQQQLLTTLERDPLGEGFSYCQRCNKLHSYDRTWGPQSGSEKSQNTRGTLCGMKDAFSPAGNPFDLGYHHARLAMNNHFYGPQFGIPLDAICIKQIISRGGTAIDCSTAAQILQDELYIRRTYNFMVPENGIDEFFNTHGFRDFRLCEHMPFLRSPSVYHQAVPELQCRSRTAPANEAFQPCRNSPGSCGICLLDYDITIQHSANDKAWKIVIRAFHQLGSCRSPDDWKWARFTERSKPRLFGPNRPNRRGSSFSPGVIMSTWLGGERSTA
uniref:F-box domain-containing protein n=1 Tax=Bionectria ochroleuca TaxID=29856 RepID=A0A8H7NKS5_BIOOC